MAGKYFEFTNPGYSPLFTRDLPYVAGSGDIAGTNPLNPSDARPLVEGEWLENASTGKGFTRGGNNACAAPGVQDGEGTIPSFPFFFEQGRYDAQASKLCHIVIGPAPMEFRTKMCHSAGLSVGSPVSVWDTDDITSGVIRRALGLQVTGYCVGFVSRIWGANDISVIYMPGAKAN